MMQKWTKQPAEPARIAFLVFDAFSNLCMANCLEPLRAANAVTHSHAFDWRILTLDGAPVETSSGIQIMPHGPLKSLEPCDYLFVHASYDHIRHDTARGRQALRVGALSTLSRNFQIGFLRPILKRLDVEVILRSGSPAELMNGLEALNLDLVLMNRPPPDDSLTPYETHKIADQEVSIVGSPDRLDPELPLQTLLETQPFVLPTTDSTVRTAFDALASRLSARPQIAAEVDDMAMMRLMAREDIGLTLVAPIVVKDELGSGRLVEAREHPRIHETFYAITLRRRFPNPLVRDLLDSSPDTSFLP